MASKFLTGHLAAEGDLSPQTIASYRDAIRLLLTWFRDVQATPPEKLRSQTSTGRGCSRSWTGSSRARQLAGDPQSAPRRDQVVRPVHRGRAARVPRPSHLDHRRQAEEDPGHRHGLPHRRRGQALLAEPDPATRRGLRDTVLLSTLYDTAARVQEICDLNIADVRAARPMLVTLHGKGSKTRRVPLMDPTARLIEDYLSRARPTPASAQTPTRCSTGPSTPD